MEPRADVRVVLVAAPLRADAVPTVQRQRAATHLDQTAGTANRAIKKALSTLLLPTERATGCPSEFSKTRSGPQLTPGSPARPPNVARGKRAEGQR